MLRTAGISFDFSHTINELSFGDKAQQKVLRWRFKEEMTNELSGEKVVHTQVAGNANLYVNHYLDITEIEIEDQTAKKITTEGPDGFPVESYPVYTGYKYRSMRTIAQTGGMNALWFIYDITPVEIHYNVFYRPWGDFIVHMCAIIGGIFAAVGLFETMVSTSLCFGGGEPAKVGTK